MKKLKGGYTGVLPMFGLIIMAFLFGVQALPISDALSQEISESYTDLNKITQAKSFTDSKHHDLGLPSAEYSINKKTIELAGDGGGFEWSNSFIPSKQNIRKELEKQTNTYLRNNYLTSTKYTRCETIKTNYTSEVSPGGEKIPFKLSTHKDKKKPAEILCNFPNDDTKINYTSKKPKFDNNFRETLTASNAEAESNRYFKLFEYSSTYLTILKDEIEKQHGKLKPYKGSSSCTCNIKEKHKENAMEGAISSAEGMLSVAKLEPDELIKGDKFKGAPWTKVLERKYSKSDLFKWGEARASTNKLKGSMKNSIKQCGCTCGDDPCSYAHSAQSKLTLDETDFYWEIKDRNPDEESLGYKVLTNNGWLDLVFKVTPYEHNF